MVDTSREPGCCYNLSFSYLPVMVISHWSLPPTVPSHANVSGLLRVNRTVFKGLKRRDKWEQSLRPARPFAQLTTPSRTIPNLTASVPHPRPLSQRPELCHFPHFPRNPTKQRGGKEKGTQGSPTLVVPPGCLQRAGTGRLLLSRPASGSLSFRAARGIQALWNGAS